MAGLFLPQRAGAQEEVAADPGAEEILDYDVELLLRDGGVMHVTETIRIRALGRSIRRGIYRDVPTTFPREGGIGTITAPFQVLAVRRDGSAEPYVVEQIDGPSGRGGERVRIGRADILLEPGVYRYEIVYETSRWLRYGAGRDTLTWNVTGNQWAFPILSASASIHLPATAPEGSVELEAWTGPVGSTDQNAEWSWDTSERTARFQTTEPLDVREGFTVRVSFPSGVVAPPTEAQRADWFRRDWGAFIEAGVVVGLVLALYLAMWVKVGRDPDRRPITVRYDPPEGFSPAQLGYLRDRGWRSSQLVAAIVNLAVKGHVTIEKTDGGDWRLQRDGSEPGNDVSKGERKLLEKMIGTGGTLILEGRPAKRMRKGMKALRAELASRLEKVYFVNNRGWFAAGAALSLAGLGFLALRSGVQSQTTIFLGAWLTLWSVGTFSLVWRAIQQWMNAFTGDVTAGFGALGSTLFSLPFVGAEIFVGYQIYTVAPLHLLAAVVAVAFVNVLFYHLLERPTLKGREVMERLEGFRRFLGATEEDRFDRMQAPDRSLELFEKYLPHAIALEVENEWAGRFEDVLDRASVAEAAGTSGHRPLAWYHGAAGVGSLSSMTSSLGSSLSSSLSSASASPSSGGSGGGGSGSSGGGGGGGGGGGW